MRIIDKEDEPDFWSFLFVVVCVVFFFVLLVALKNPGR